MTPFLVSTSGVVVVVSGIVAVPVSGLVVVVAKTSEAALASADIIAASVDKVSDLFHAVRSRSVCFQAPDLSLENTV